MRKSKTKRAERTRIKTEHCCQVCQKTFGTNYTLVLHTNLHTKENVYGCPICGKIYYLKSSLARHLTRHHKQRKYKCTSCAKTYLFKSSLLLHKKLDHAKADIVQKQITDESCSNDGVVPPHLDFEVKLDKLEHAADSLTNEHLPQAILRPNNDCSSEKAPQHLSVNHPMKKKKYECEVCGKGFAASRYRTQHMHFHSHSSCQKCNVCGKEYSTRGSLSRHMNIHTKEKEFKCSTCDKVFYNRSNLVQHRRVHSLEENLKCNVCEKTFTWKQTLKRHLELHEE